LVIELSFNQAENPANIQRKTILLKEEDSMTNIFLSIAYNTPKSAPSLPRLMKKP
jgi:hypothetical protein